MALTAQFSSLPDRVMLGARWRELEARGAASFFLGWTWIDAWLDSYAIRPELLSVTDANGDDMGLALVGHAMQPRLLGRAATLFLSESGDPVADRPYVEYNGLLAAAGAESDATLAALAAIAGRNDWRVFRLAGVLPDSPMLALPGRRATRLDASPVYQVDLAAVRDAGGDYLSLLSANTRSQVRRAMKDRGGAMPGIAVARDLDEIDAGLGEMLALNTGRHADNAWDDPAFRTFVRGLLVRGLANGQVELLRLTDAGGLVGLLVNFIYRGVAMNYQSAFAAPLSPRDKPGLLCHAAAVARYAGMDCARYSLLAGKDRYKQSLATCQERLEWWAIERFSPRLEAEAFIRRIFRRPISA
ncbi:GNAT family N-acetyltransferase [Sphingobium sp. AN641]|uniref:GNAT family N-acetyltransferase n=1 Tax=Sphingobium sp. AN641 TaxID=3133443 RepID=UPI0030C0C350